MSDRPIQLAALTDKNIDFSNLDKGDLCSSESTTAATASVSYFDGFPKIANIRLYQCKGPFKYPAITRGGGGVSQMITVDNKGGGGVSQMITDDHR